MPVIFLDANFFLRALTTSTDPKIQRMNRIAGDLFRQAERGEVEVTTSDAVIAEVAFVLTSKAHYHLAVADAAGLLSALLRLRGVKLGDKRLVLRALDYWMSFPRLGFVDALTAAYVQQPEIKLATFDDDFDHFPDLARWQPANEGTPA